MVRAPVTMTASSGTTSDEAGDGGVQRQRAVGCAALLQSLDLGVGDSVETQTVARRPRRVGQARSRQRRLRSQRQEQLLLRGQEVGAVERRQRRALVDIFAG